MTLTGFLLIPLVFGLVGAITPCALGINVVFLGYAAGKPRLRRLVRPVRPKPTYQGRGMDGKEQHRCSLTTVCLCW